MEVTHRNKSKYKQLIIYLNIYSIYTYTLILTYIIRGNDEQLSLGDSACQNISITRSTTLGTYRFIFYFYNSNNILITSA